MQPSLFVIVVTLIFLFITAFLGYLGYRQTKSSQDYMVAGRKAHPVIMALSYGATFISTSAIVGFGGLAANMGMGLLWLTFLNVFVGIFIAFVVFGKRTRKMGHTLDAHTFPELLAKRFNSRFIQGFSGILIFLFMPLYAASVIKGGANFVETYFGIDYSVALLAFVSIVAIYVWMGGMKGVMYTDAFQGSIMFVSMVTLLIIAYTKLGGITAAHRSLDQLFSNPDIQKDIAGSISKGFQGWLSMPKTGSPNWWNLVTAIVTGVGIGVLTQPQLIVRFMSVKSNRELNRAVLSGGVFILAMTGIAFVVGALSNVLLFNKMGKISIAAAGGVVDKIIPLFISTYIPDWFGAIFLISMLAAAMSTLSSQFHAMGTAIGRDVYERAFRGKGKTIFINKVGILVVILISTVLAYLTKHMSASDAIIAKGTTIFFELTTAVFLPAYLGALYFKKMPRAAVIAGMISGFVTWFFWNFFVHSNAASLQLCKLLTGKTSLVADIPSLSNLMMVGTTYIALPVSILVTGLVWLVFALNRKKDLDDAHVQKCFEGL